MIELLGNHVWQSTLCAAAAGLLTLTLGKNRAQARYWVWLAASVKFLVPFALLVAVGGQFGSQFGWRRSSDVIHHGVQPTVAANVVTVIAAVGRPFSRPAPRVASSAAVGEVADGSVSAVPGVFWALAALAAVWSVGCGAMALLWAIRWSRVAAAVRRGSPVAGGRELQVLRRLERIGGITRPIGVVSSDAPLEPGVFGILRPVLLWPRSITARLGDEQVEAILAHELCHVRRRDNLTSALHAIVQALFWFHPLVWFVGARLVAERERACDEEVVRLGSDPRVYAESILKTCQFFVESPRVCVSGVTGSDLKQRIAQILSNESRVPLNGWRRCLLGAAGVAVIAVPTAIGVTSGPQLGAQVRSVVNHRRGFGPPDLNRLLGFELLPGPRPHPTDDPGGAAAWRVAVDHPAGRMSFVGFTGRGLIRYAYGLRDLTVVEGPGWIDTESVEISATISTTATDDELRSAVRKLLEERVKLRAHHEARDIPVYALVAANNDRTPGPSLRRSTSSCVGAGAMPLAAWPGSRNRAAHSCGLDDGVTGVTFESVSMADLAEDLSRLGSLLDRQVVDRTGMTGTFDGALGFGFLPAAAVLTRYPATAGFLEPFGVRSIFTALPDQLGLRLEDATMPGEVLVIDHAERPAAEK